MSEEVTIDASAQAARGERRQVTILFTDMVGYTAIVEELGEDRALDFTQMIYERLTKAVLAHGGIVRSFAGDSIMAVFGIPDAQEDCALRACRAAEAIHASFAEEEDEIAKRFGVQPQMRVGVSSGLSVMASVQGAGSELTAVGHTVNLASRIQALAPERGTLLCDETRRLVDGLCAVRLDGTHKLRGLAKPQKLWLLEKVHTAATRFDASLARGLSAYIGRAQEQATMDAALAEAQNRTRVLDLVAEPGLGKTRLVFEFMQRARGEGLTELVGQCAIDGQQVPFYPFLEVVRGAFRILEEDPAAEVARKLDKGLRNAGMHSQENLGLMLNLLGIDPPDGALDGLDGVLIGLRTRDLLPAMLHAVCETGMVVLRLEDIHWLDSASEAFLERLVGDGTQPNLMIIQTRRPEYVPPWVDTDCVTTLALEPLSAQDIRDLVQTRLGAQSLPDALVAQVTERAGGNPLFGEEILSFLLHLGALKVEEGVVSFDAELGATGLPASMQSLFTARMDRFDKRDRTVLQAAAAMGRRFAPWVLSMVLPELPDIDAVLLRLEQHDVIHREENSTDYIFKHVLLRDSVYLGLLADQRAALHLAIGDAIAARSADRLSEVAGSLAYHYGLTERSGLAFTYAALAGARGLGIFSLDEANRYFATALSLYEADPSCAEDEKFAAMLADYALSCSLSLEVKTLTELAVRVRLILERFGDSRNHAHFLHHYTSCLIWNGRYRDAQEVSGDLAAMAERLGDDDVTAYALVTQMSVSCYNGRLTNESFEDLRHRAGTLMEGLDDAYLKNFFMAHIGWNEVGRGRVLGAHAAADALIEEGNAMNDPRALGYGTAMKALIAMVSNDYEKALEKSEQALAVSRAAFESAIADASKHSALVPLGHPDAVAQVERYVARCAERGLTLFLAGPDTMLGVALVLEGQITKGLDHIEKAIARREAEGYNIAANWYRLFLCEIYLEILAGNGGASAGVLLRNIRALGSIILFGPKRIIETLDYVRANSDYDPDGHYVARMEMILGLLFQIKKKTAQARQHLTEARRIVAPTGPSPMLTRIEEALAKLDA